MRPNHIDERGTITDLMVTDEYSVTHITFNEGAVRGNHYHEKTTQYDVVLKGKFIYANDKGEQVINMQDMIVNEPNVPHAYKAKEYSEMLSICFGIRRGEDYEKDVIRLEIPLLK